MTKLEKMFMDKKASLSIAYRVRPHSTDNLIGFTVQIEVTTDSKTYLDEDWCASPEQIQSTKDQLTVKAERWFFRDKPAEEKCADKKTGQRKTAKTAPPAAPAPEEDPLTAALNTKLALLPAAPSKARKFDGMTIGELRETVPVTLRLLAKGEGTPQQAVTEDSLKAIKIALQKQ